jgi:hypothetical protein
MMKKTRKLKLSLNRETLHHLEENRMAAVDGGAPPSQRPVCNSKNFSECDTCGIVCTYNCPA